MIRPDVVVQRDQVGRAMGCTVDGIVMPAVRTVLAHYHADDIVEVTITLYAATFREEIQVQHEEVKKG